MPILIYMIFMFGKKKKKIHVEKSNQAVIDSYKYKSKLFSHTKKLQFLYA